MSSENNANNLRNKITNIQEKILELRESNKTDVEIEMYFVDNEKDTYENYPFLVKKLIKGGSMDYLDVMLKSIEKMEKGEQTRASIEAKLGNDLAQEFLYPVINNNNKK